MAILCTVAGCSPADRDPGVEQSRSTDPGAEASRCPGLEKLKSADPVADATTALAHGDHHLLMLGGYAGTVPGGEGTALPTEMIKGTSDVTTMACVELRWVAEAYARRYNATVVAATDH
jgi:hypothetical protein